MSDQAPPPTERVQPSPDEFLVAQASPEFTSLRRTLLRFIVPMSVFFLLWYAVYVVLGAFADDFMGTKVWGNINLGLILGLLQFVTTFAITAAYVKFSGRDLDPKAEQIRQNFADGVYADTAEGIR
ncbi:DUF485 domain-containing protein [Gordonia sp. HY285]|uniref:DUF485 domain-containing protein n=1 Tax=Gordonia liuliyuniae TaxID=2911517 RepID=A0ABS9ISX1_9ACTN|nr:DUF485 domain-containing protein [Gordonia liuliyuniae]MCF8588610.1 DUF485 domain-containing protein [Gordonia liuliyuniae]MCF8609509.1 DUF485 domain-containing protein [Gordonia liuliyuniae]